MQTRRVSPLLLALATLAILAACSSSGFHYVQQSDEHTYFKVPESWKLFDENQMLAADRSLSKDERAAARDATSQTGFDANPKPSVRHLLVTGTRYPAGQAIVATLTSSVADELSLKSLRNLFFDIDGTDESTGAKVLDYRPVKFDGGFRGSKLVAELTKGKKSFTVNQIAVVDQDTRKVYALIVTCTTTCYHTNQSKIDTVVDSWTVKDK
jgi:hypothetical protein